jgi:hypothetical protein
MNVADGPDVYGYTIFCDEIRIEAAGKLFYIGTYAGGTMFIHRPFPTILPRLALDIVYLQRHTKFVMPKNFIIALPGETEQGASIRFDVAAEQAEEIRKSAEASYASDPERALVRMGGPVSLTNIEIKQPGRLMVRATRNDEYIRLGTLNILQGEIPDRPSPPQPSPAETL